MTPQLQITTGSPATAWVILNHDDGRAWIVPATPNGWSRRIPYHGNTRGLRPASGSSYMGLGVPLRREWSDVCSDRHGFN